MVHQKIYDQRAALCSICLKKSPATLRETAAYYIWMKYNTKLISNLTCAKSYSWFNNSLISVSSSRKLSSTGPANDVDSWLENWDNTGVFNEPWSILSIFRSSILLQKSDDDLSTLSNCEKCFHPRRIYMLIQLYSDIMLANNWSQPEFYGMYQDRRVSKLLRRCLITRLDPLE